MIFVKQFKRLRFRNTCLITDTTFWIIVYVVFFESTLVGPWNCFRSDDCCSVPGLFWLLVDVNVY